MKPVAMRDRDRFMFSSSNKKTGIRGIESATHLRLQAAKCKWKMRGARNPTPLKNTATATEKRENPRGKREIREHTVRDFSQIPPPV